MRASVTSLSQKLLAVLCAATLTLGLVPAAAFAVEEQTTENESTESVISTEASDSERSGEISPIEDSQDESVGASFMWRNGEDEIEDNATTGDDSNLSIPAALERINQDVSLTQPVAQQESTRSYFLAQTLESTKTVPIVSANLPLDKGASSDVVEPDTEGESDGSSETEGGEDSDESDPGVISTEASDSERSGEISAASTVIGSFTYEGLTFAVEPGGESVALVAIDYNQLPEQSIEMQVIAIPEIVSADGIDYYSVTRIADNALSSLTKDKANPEFVGCEALFADEALLSEAGIDAADIDALLNPESDMIDIDGDGEPDTVANPLKDCAGILALGIPSSVTSIGDDAFAGADTLQYLVVAEDNPDYATFDGALYSADLTNLRLIPEGRVGAVRVAPSATDVSPEAFSHCPSLDTLVADPESTVWEKLNANLNYGCDSSIRLYAIAKADEQGLVIAHLPTIVSSVFDALANEAELQEKNTGTSMLLDTNRSIYQATSKNDRKLYVVSNTGTVYRKYWRDTTGETSSGATDVPASYEKPYTTAYIVRDQFTVKLENGSATVQMERSDDGSAFTFRFGTTMTGEALMGVDVAYLAYFSRYTGKKMLSRKLGDDQPPIRDIDSGDVSGGAFVLFLNYSYKRSINWDANGGKITKAVDAREGDPTSGVGMSRAIIDKVVGLQVERPTAEREGYVFEDWFTKRTAGFNLEDLNSYIDGTDSFYMPSVPFEIPNESITQEELSKRADLVGANTYYAHWIAKTSNLTFDLQGGFWKSGETLQDTTTATYDSVMPGICRKNSTNAMSIPEKTGYTFVGFYDDTQQNSAANKYYTDALGSHQDWNKNTTSGTNLYAWWTPKMCTLEFDLDGGKGGGTLTGQTATYGEAMPTAGMSVPTKDGYEFQGYFTAKNCGGTKYYETSYYDKDAGYCRVASANDWAVNTMSKTTLYAGWKAGQVSITWDANGGKWSDDKTKRTGDQTCDDDLALEAAPSQDGYSFAGWFTSATGGTQKKDTDKVPTSTATYYAHWTPKVYTIELRQNNTDSGSTAGTTVIYQKYATGWYSDSGCAANKEVNSITTPTRIGYKFKGYSASDATNAMVQYWSADALIQTTVYNPENTTFNSDSTGITLYAKWEKAIFAITLNYDNESDGKETIYEWHGKGWYSDKEATSRKETITAPTWNGRKFLGYSTVENAASANCWTVRGGTSVASSVANPVNTAFDAACSVHAVWEKCTYTIKWEMKGHGKEPSTTEYTFGDTLTLPSVPDDGGWKFEYWCTDDACTTKASNITATTTSNKTFYAKWTPKKYKIEYKMKDHGTAPTSVTEWEYGTPTELPDPDKVEGWTFGGWFTDNNCTSPASIKADTTGPLTVYAKWTLNSHKVYWRYDGGNGGSDTEETKSFGDEFSLRNPGSKQGYKFAGWKTSGTVDNGNTYGEDYLTTKKFVMPDGAVTFTAQWNPYDYTKVSLSDPYLSESTAQGEIWYWPEMGYVDSAMSKTVIGFGKHIKNVPNLKSEGYEFLGWCDDVNENKFASKMIDEFGNVNTAYAPAAPAEGEAIVWYAHWNRVSCPVDLVASYEPSSEEDAFAIENADSYMKRIQYAYFDAAFSESVEGGTIPEGLLPERVGYTFMGYYTQKNPEVSVADSTDASKYNGTQWIASDGKLTKEIFDQRPGKRENFTLYAAWRLDECEVTFDATGNVNGVETDKEPVTLVNAPNSTKWSYGKEKTGIPKPGEATFYRMGYTFGGWYYLNGSDKVFVTDKDGNPTPVNWDVVKTSVTLYPFWTAKEYTLWLGYNYPPIPGEELGLEDFESMKVVYDEPLDLSKFTPEFAPYTFKGWYTDTEQFFEETHMTESSDGTKRFTPRGSYASMSEIDLHAHWSEPGKYQYTLLWKFPGTDEIVESVHDYYFTDTVKFDGTEAPTPVPSGYRFEGWVEMPYYKDAHDALSGSGPYMEGDTTDGWKPMSMRDRFFVAKWNTRAFSVSFSTTPVETTESGESWIRNTDLLENWSGTTDALSWEEACELAGQAGSDMSTGITYDVTMPSFVLPDVKRKGQVFEGWKLLDENGNPTGTAARGIVVEPSKQDAQGMRDLVYVPVFKDALYAIILDANVYGEEMRFEGDEAIPYSSEFTFPYPATLSTGSVFVCWGEDTNTVSNGTQRFYPMQTVKLAPTYNEMGEMTAFGLAHLANDENEIRLYAVWNNAEYHVDVPLFANLAIDTDRGDVIAGTNTISPDPENADTDAVYRIESIRYEPLKNDDGVYAFQREGDPTDKVYLSVYAGLNTGEATDLEHLLYAENVGEGGELTYTDADSETATATPLLIELGGTTPVVYGRTAPENQASLESVTDADAPYGFVTFSQKSPLTIRYGLYFENEQTRKDFAFGSTKYQWLLPKNDGANKKTEFVNTEDEDYGRGNAWSGDTVDIAKLHYTVSVSNAKAPNAA